MSKLVRFDDDHFGYLVDTDLAPDLVKYVSDKFTDANPGKTLIVMQADEFIDLAGQYEIVPILEPVA